MRYERTAHEVTLYAPQAAGLQCIVSLHTDGAYIGHQMEASLYTLKLPGSKQEGAEIPVGVTSKDTTNNK